MVGYSPLHLLVQPVWREIVCCIRFSGNTPAFKISWFLQRNFPNVVWCDTRFKPPFWIGTSQNEFNRHIKRFSLLIYDLQNEISHDSNTFRVHVFPQQPTTTIFGWGRKLQLCQKYFQLSLKLLFSIVWVTKYL